MTVALRGIHTDSDPYPDKTPREMLGRKYHIYDHLLNASSFTIKPVALLMQNPTFLKYLSNFEMFRFGIELDFQFITTPNVYGGVMIGYLPSLVIDPTLKNITQSNGIILDVSEQQALHLVLPYIRPQQFYTREDFLIQNDLFDWNVMIQPHLATVTTTTSSTVMMSVFANAVDIQASGYVAEGVFQSLPMTLRDTHTRHPIGKLIGMAGSLASAATLGYNMYSGATTPYETLKLTFKDEDKNPSNSSKTKLDILGNLTGSSVDHCSAISLGDPMKSFRAYEPMINDYYELLDICRTPSCMGVHTLDNSNEAFDLDITPMYASSHTEYLSRMFRYWRGGSHVFLKFCLAQSISAKLKITLFPTTFAGAGSTAFGNLPTWIVTLKGTSDWGVEIPYLQKTAWQDVNIPTGFIPTLRIELLSDLPQPFDKPVSIIIFPFICAADDFQFSMLQSSTPSQEAEFQCDIRDSLTKVERVGMTTSGSFMGYQGDIYSILRRFSNRAVVPTSFFPFPLKINSLFDSYSYDNFDYLSQLYIFFNGSNHLKILFSSAPADGSLKATILNSKPAVLAGRSFSSGNSIVATNQAVWPSLDFVFPYNCVNEFNIIAQAEPMYSIAFTEDAVISEYLIAATEETRLFYLRPTPDWAVFQSGQRPLFSDCRTGFLQISAGDTDSNIQILNEVYYQNRYFEAKLDLWLDRTSGTTSDPFTVVLASAPKYGPIGVGSTALGPGAYASTVLVANQDGYAVGSCSFYRGYPTTTGELHLSILSAQVTLSSSYNLYYSLSMQPFSSSVTLGNPEYEELGGFTAVRGFVSIANEFDFLEVHVTNTPEVSIPYTISTNVENVPGVRIASQDVDLDVRVVPGDAVQVYGLVTIDNPDPLEVTGRVQGVLDTNPTPVKVTYY